MCNRLVHLPQSRHQPATPADSYKCTHMHAHYITHQQRMCCYWCSPLSAGCCLFNLKAHAPHSPCKHCAPAICIECIHAPALRGMFQQQCSSTPQGSWTSEECTTIACGNPSIINLQSVHQPAMFGCVCMLKWNMGSRTEYLFACPKHTGGYFNLRHVPGALSPLGHPLKPSLAYRPCPFF